jgi:imidazolonepropionase-like amidohydrolase
MGGWDGEAADLLGYQRYLNALLYAGVTTVLDTGNMLLYIQQLRDEIASGHIAGPRIYMTGPLVDGPDPTWPPSSIALASAAQAEQYVKQLKIARVDFVKAYGGLSVPALDALIGAAKKESLRVLADMWDRNGTAEIASAGIAAFAHLGYAGPVTDEALEIMLRRHVASITTLAAQEAASRRRLADLRFIEEPLIRDTMPPQFVAELKSFAKRPLTDREGRVARRAEGRLRTFMGNAKRLLDAGVLLAAGTDAALPGVYYGEGLHHELELLVEAGLTPLQAITLATKNAALLLNEDKDWGTLEAGKRADLLVVSGDPARRIGDTRNVSTVMQRGRIIDRDALRFDSKKDPGFGTTGSVSWGSQ